MKKTILYIVAGIAIVIAVMSGVAYTEVRANDKALETIRSDDGAVVLKVSGMT